MLGFDGVPEAGEHVRVVENDRRARQLANERANRLKTEALARRGGRKVSLEDDLRARADGELKELNLVLKADVAGSLEAFEDEIAKLPQQEVQVNVIRARRRRHHRVRRNLAAASDAVVLGFNVRPVGEARQLADREGVEIRTYAVIYRAIDELRDAMQGMLAPEEVEETLGHGRGPPDLPRLEGRHDRRLARHRGQGHPRRAASRLVRDGTVVYDGQIASLRRFNDDVREVPAGFECGIVLENFADLKEGDVLEVYETRQVERTLVLR